MIYGITRKDTMGTHAKVKTSNRINSRSSAVSIANIKFPYSAENKKKRKHYTSKLCQYKKGMTAFLALG